MTHVEFEINFAEQAERFGIAKIIRQVGEEYAFQSFMLALSGIVARDQTSPINEEELDKLAMLYDLNHDDIPPYANTATVWNLIREAFKAGYRKAMEE